MTQFKQAENNKTIQSVIEEKELSNKDKGSSKNKSTKIKPNDCEADKKHEHLTTSISKKPVVNSSAKKNVIRQLPAWMIGGSETQTKKNTTGVCYNHIH